MSHAILSATAADSNSRSRNSSRYATSSEIARLCGVSFMTVNRACDSQDIECIKTAGGHRRIEVKSACEFFGCPLPESYRASHDDDLSGERIIAAYARCSTQKQADNLKRQVERLEAYIGENYPGAAYRTFQEIGSGINNERPQLLRLLDFVLAGRVSVLLVEFGDRLSRSARSLIVSICQKCGCEVVETRTGEQENKAATEQDEMLCDITSIMTVYAAKQHGKRAGEKTRFVASPELKTSVAALYAEGKSVKQICSTVIAEGHKCLNTGRVVGKWSVWKLIDEVKADLNKSEAAAVPQSLEKFVKSYCVVSRAKRVYGAAFYQTFKAFCEREGFEMLNNQVLAATLRAMGFKHVREEKGYSTVYGLSLKHNPEASKNRKGFSVILPPAKRK